MKIRGRLLGIGPVRRLLARVAASFAVADLGGVAGLSSTLSDPRWLVLPVALGVMLTIVLDINWSRRRRC